MSNFFIRAVSGAVFVILVLGSILLDPLVFAGFFLLITLLGLWEFYSLFAKGSYYPNRWLGSIAGGLLYLAVCLVHPGLGRYFFDTTNLIGTLNYIVLFAEILVSLILVAFILILAEIFRKKEHPFENAAIGFLGIIYIAVPLALLNTLFYVLPKQVSSPNVLLGIFLLIWANDTFAYLSGMLLGKHPLCARLSPKKTWEGSVGGAIFSLLTAGLLSILFTAPGILTWLSMGIVIIIFGTLGDLAESMLKRSFGIKDSGSIMPGHGGILDRFDAVLMATPFVLLVLLIAYL